MGPKQAAVLAWFALSSLGWAARESAPVERPFPLKTTTLKEEGVTYFIQGRVRLPHNQSVSSLRQMVLIGRGEDAVLEVSGKLEMKAVTGGRNTIRDLVIEVMPDCKDLLVTTTDLHGRSMIRTSTEGPGDCEIFLQGLSMLGSTKLTLEMSGGQVDVQSSRFGKPVHIRGVHPSEKSRAKLKLILLSNRPSGGGSDAGLIVEDAWDVLVRNNELGGAHSRIENCRKVDVDGNNVRSRLFELIHDDVKGFKQTKVLSCDFRSANSRFFAPLNPKKPDSLERFNIHGSWFKGLTEPEEIRAECVEDSGRDERNGMLIKFKKISKGPRGLGGTGGA
ncbi:MAG: hypothetical protein ACI8QC_000262 [Planctomycetota bacterium]|jgi:hypothetical protein